MPRTASATAYGGKRTIFEITFALPLCRGTPNFSLKSFSIRATGAIVNRSLNVVSFIRKIIADGAEKSKEKDEKSEKSRRSEFLRDLDYTLATSMQ